MPRTRIKGPLGLVVLTSVLLLPAPAWAQAISGLVRDASVGVLPGVTVEAASPALIEKFRTVQTDGQGRYNIVDLRPGTYVVTFSLLGFASIRREGIELTSGFTSTVNADMQVGSLAETITVSGAAPLVDVQNVVQQNLVPKALLEALPSSSKSVTALASIVPGLSGPSDGGGAVGLQRGNNVLHNSIHGKGGAKYSFDGMQTNNFSGADGGTSYLSNPAFVLEIAVQTGGMDADSNASGISFNMIPNEGGNRFAFEFSGMYSGESMQGDNLSDELRARGGKTASRVLQLYDATAAVGGPIKKDRLWFFTASRFAGNKNTGLQQNLWVASGSGS